MLLQNYLVTASMLVNIKSMKMLLPNEQASYKPMMEIEDHVKV